MLNETFGLTDMVSISFTDVKSDAWYYEHIRKAKAQGYLLSSGSTYSPDAKLTREEAAALLVRYLDLPEDEKASTSKFSDYSSINSSYRNYVLQAAEAGVFGGYEDGTFGPKRTLNRAEALTILYRAAGSVYKATTKGVDSGAAAENAVITQSGITIRDASLSGRILISEGVGKYGRVTFEDCKLRGEVIVRSGLSIYFKDCDVYDLTINATSEPTLYLEGDTTVEDILLNATAGIDTEADTVIDSLVVTADADESGVSGSGTLKKLTVKGREFVSSVMPVDFKIDDGLSATLAGAVYPLSAASGFENTPAISTIGSYEYLNGKTIVGGTLYWYYTNDGTVPASGDACYSTYMSASTHSSIKGTSSVAKGGSVSLQLLPTYNALSYRYVVILITSTAGHCKPLLLDRQAASATPATAPGFSVAPKVTTNSSNDYDYLTGTPSASGTIYYYYTTSSVAPASVAAFAQNFNSVSASSQSLVGTVTVTAGSAINQSLKTASSVTGYRYVVMAIHNSTTGYTTPIVIERNSTSAPVSSAYAVTVSGTYDYLTGTPANNGAIYYYYSAANTQPTSSTEFWNNYQVSYYNGSVNTTAGTALSNAQMKPTADVAGYPYVVLMIAPSDGTAYSFTVVTRTGSSATTGFTVTASGTYDYLNGTPAKSGTLYYYYTNTYSVPTYDAFLSAYTNTASAYRGTVGATAGHALSNALLKASSSVGSYSYVVILLIPSDGSASTPQLLLRNGGSVGTAPFAGTPYFSYENNTEYMTATPLQSGTLYWYYINSASLFPASGDAAYTNWTNTSESYRGWDTTTASSQKRFTLKDYSGVYNYSYIVAFISYYNGYATVNTAPVLISKNNTTLTTNGFSATPSLSKQNGFDYLNATPTVSGTIKYYYTNNNQKPTSADFDTFFGDTMYYKGSLTAVVNTPQSGNYATLWSDTAVSSYQFVVIRLETSDGLKYDPVVLSRTVTTVSGTGFTVAPSYALYNDTDSISVTPAVTGKLYWYYTTLSDVPARADYSGLYNYASLKSYYTVSSANHQPVYMKKVSERSGYSYIVFQMEDAYGNRYDPVICAINVSTTSAGFHVGPNWSSDGTYDRIGGYTVKTGGKLHFYYTTIGTTPASVDAFNTAYGNAAVRSQLVLSSGMFDVPLVQNATVSGYPYVVVMYEDPDGIKYQPVLLYRQSTASGTGFASDNMPFAAVSAATGNIYLHVEAPQTCKVKYYLTDNAILNDFDTGYAGAPNTVKALEPETVLANDPKDIVLGSAASLTAYTHVAIRVQSPDGTRFYEPFVIQIEFEEMNGNDNDVEIPDWW